MKKNVKYTTTTIPAAIAPAINRFVELLEAGHLASLVGHFDDVEDSWRSRVVWSPGHDVVELEKLAAEAAELTMHPRYG